MCVCECVCVCVCVCVCAPLDKQYLISRDVCHITEGGVIQAQKLQRPLQLLEGIDATLARLHAERQKNSGLNQTFYFI